jgi:glycosyltransferase involved in cell wall biosynthesis
MSMSRIISRNGLVQRETKGAMGADSQAKRIHVIFTGTDPETNSGGIGVVLKGYFRALEIAEIPFSSVPTYHPRQFGGKTLKFFFALPRLAASILSGRWQGRNPVVYSHAGAGVSLLRESVVLLFSRVIGARTVLHIHAPAIDGYLNGVVKRGLLKLCLSIPGMVVVLTPWWKDRLQSAGIGSPIRVVANPLLPELELIALEQGPRTGQPRSEDRVTVLTMARLVRGKGIEIVIRAMAALPEHVRLVVAGEGAEKKKLENEVLRMGLSGRVEFSGWVSGEDKARLLREADIFCLPSTRDAFPMSYVEAMAYGVPVVGARWGGIPDMMAHGVAGLLVDPDPSEVAGAIGALLDPETRERMGAAAKEWVLSISSPEVVGKTLRHAFEEMVYDGG